MKETKKDQRKEKGSEDRGNRTKKDQRKEKGSEDRWNQEGSEKGRRIGG